MYSYARWWSAVSELSMHLVWHAEGMYARCVYYSGTLCDNVMSNYSLMCKLMTAG